MGKSGAAASAGPAEAQLIAAGLYPYRAGLWPEAQSAGNAIFQQTQMGIFKFDHLLAVQADQMIMVWVIDEIRIVVSLVPPQIDFLE